MPDDIVIGARQIKNPKNIKPQWDDGVDPKNPQERYGYVKKDIHNPVGKPTMDMHNPPQSDLVPKKPHPIDDWFGRGIKRSNGNDVPREDVKISEN